MFVYYNWSITGSSKCVPRLPFISVSKVWGSVMERESGEKAMVALATTTSV